MSELGRYQPVIIYVMRVVIGVIFFHHGAEKVFDFELVLEKYETLGFPGLLWVSVGLFEMGAVVALFSDRYYKQGCWLLIVIIALAILTIQLPVALKGGLQSLGTLERDLLILVVNIFLLASGGGGLYLIPRSEKEA